MNVDYVTVIHNQYLIISIMNIKSTHYVNVVYESSEKLHTVLSVVGGVW
jgi:hypothetical protein